MKKKMIFAIGLAVVVVVTWLLMRGNKDGTEDAMADNRSNSSAVKGAKGKKSRKMLSRRSKGEVTKARREIDAAADRLASGNWTGKRRRVITHSTDIESTWTDEDGNPWPEEQRILMRAVVDAAEAEDFTAVATLAKEVINCENADLREQYVDELGWFGAQALGDLLPFLADANEDVVEAVRSQITDAYQDVDTDAEKAAVYTLLSRAVIDTEVLESLSDELEVMDEVIALQAIVDTIGDGTPEAQEAAKAAYKEITDADWTDIDAAEEWLRENYVSDDDPADDEPSNESTGTGNAEAVGDGVMSGDGGGKDEGD